MYEDSLSRQLLEALAREVREAGTSALHVAAGFFSWGDAVHQALAAAKPGQISIVHDQAVDPA